MRGDRLTFASAGRCASRPGVVMFLSLFSAFAVGLAITVALMTLVAPFVHGLFDRRDNL